MATHAERMPARRPLSVPGWVIALFILLVAGALGIGFLIGRAAEATPTTVGSASEATVEQVDGMLAIWSDGDTAEASTYYADYAIIDDRVGGVSYVGLEEIESIMADTGGEGWRFDRTTDVVQRADWVAFGVTYGPEGDQTEGIVALQLEGDGQIVEQVVMGS